MSLWYSRLYRVNTSLDHTIPVCTASILHYTVVAAVWFYVTGRSSNIWLLNSAGALDTNVGYWRRKMSMQRVHVCAAIILCIAHACLSSENRTVNNNATKSESNDLKSTLNLAGNVTESLDTAKPDEDHTQTQRNTSEDGEEMNKETHGAKPGEFMISLRVEGRPFRTIFFKCPVWHAVITCLKNNYESVYDLLRSLECLYKW